MTLVEMIRRFGVGARLKHAVIADRNWRRADYRSGDEGEWYARWPAFAVELNAAIREVRG